MSRCRSIWFGVYAVRVAMLLGVGNDPNVVGVISGRRASQ